jgi:tol-pal system protein YbgF
MSSFASQSIFKLTLVLALSSLSFVTNAALFGDDEARRAILDLRQRLEATQKKLDATQQKLDATQQRLETTQQSVKSQSDDNAILRRSLLELQNQIDSLKSDQAVMRGSFEQFLKDLSEVQVKQKDVLQTVDSRLSKFEPIKVTLDGLEFQADPAEKNQFDGALTVFRTGDFAAAQNSLSAFLLKYPSSGFAPSALFWLGNAQYATKDYKESIANFRKLLSIAPQHARAPEAMLAISNNWVELKDLKAAKKAMEDLVKLHPASEASQTAKQRLTRFK